jgi:hypothetical protein
MMDMVTEARAEWDERVDSREEARRSCSIYEKMGETTTHHLILLCRATNDGDLPDLYHEWTAHPQVVSENWVFQQVVDAACATQGMPSFEVTPTQVMAFKNFRFAGSSNFDIGSGVLPFSITPADAT